MSNTTRVLVLCLCVTLSGGCESQADECVETRSPLAFTDAGPWGVSPADAYAHVEGARSGTLTWHEGGEAGVLTPSAGQTDVTVNVVLDMESATAVDSEHVGGGRLACVDSIEMKATVEISSADGALAETMQVDLSAAAGEVGDVVVGWVDLSGHVWTGALEWMPMSSDEQLFMRLSWTNDATQTARGWLIWGEQAEVDVEGNMVTGAGVSQVLGEFEATI